MAAQYVTERLTKVDRHTQQTQKNGIIVIQRRTNVEDVGPALDKCYTNVLC